MRQRTVAGGCARLLRDEPGRTVLQVGRQAASEKYKTPVAGLLVQACWTALLCVSGSYSQLLDYIIFAVLVFYILTIVGLFVLRVKQPDARAAVQGARLPGAARALHRHGFMDLYRIIAIQAPIHVAGPGARSAGNPGLSLLVAPVCTTERNSDKPYLKPLWRMSLTHVQSVTNQTDVDAHRRSRGAGRTYAQALARSASNLVTLGIGAVIGAGIFTLTGQAAALRAGPAVALSFVVAGLTCAFAGLCYAEFASIIPIAGSAYTYGYATLGELVAWIIGWDLTLEYAFGASTVASGWAGYFNSLLQQFHIYLPPQLTATTGTPLVFYHDQWLQLMSLPPGVSDAGLPHATGVFNLIAVVIVMVITTILVIGIKESANFNSAIVIIKVTIVCVFLVVGGWFLFQAS